MIRSLIQAAIFLAILPSILYGAELKLGLGAIDQGDDVPRPGAQMELDINQTYMTGFMIFGRQFQSVTEAAYVGYFGIKKKLFGNLPILGRLGVSLLDETTKINDEALKDSEHNINLGVLLGASYKISLSIFTIQLSWDSHLYPAGINGFFLLATGRKQMVAISIGMRL